MLVEPSDSTRVIAFYLPQYHPIPENDRWWGKGFTEWTNVSASKPRFSGHYQPHLPADLGFYDLRVEETRIEQTKLATRYNIAAFCYYHYWFNGKRLLDRPLNDVLKTGKPDFPFCLCWANENWTRAWDGLEREVLIKQDYTEADARAHIEWLLDIFRDDRYIKIGGRPVFLIYRLDNIPNTGDFIRGWRSAARAQGFPDLYLCAVKNGFVQLSDEEILGNGFDAVVDFQPNRNDFPKPRTLSTRLQRIARQILPDAVYQRLKVSVSANNIVNYRAMVDGIMAKHWPKKYRKFPCVFPSWDNSARRKSPTIIQNDDPALYQRWLTRAIENVQPYPPEERLVFINAWNEWAEGCHLEPDRRFGHAFLRATAAAAHGGRGVTAGVVPGLVVDDGLSAQD